MLHSLAFQMPGLGEWIVIGAIGLLLFGKRLPEVGKSLGKGIVEFKKGLKSIDDDIDEASNRPTPPPTAPSANVPAGAKFDPYTGKPLQPQPMYDPHTGKPLNENQPTA